MNDPVATRDLAEALRMMTGSPEDRESIEALIVTAGRIAPPPTRNRVRQLAAQSAATAAGSDAAESRAVPLRPTRLRRTSWRARLVATVAAWSLWAKVATAAVATAAVTAGLGTAGALPPRVQQVVADVGRSVGLELPAPAPRVPSSPDDARQPDGVVAPPVTGDRPSTTTTTTTERTPSGPGIAAPVAPADVEVFAVGAAGWVTISSDGVRLVLVEVVAAAGWSAEVTDLKDDQIDVTFSHPETDATFTAQLNDGVVKIDIDPGKAVSEQDPGPSEVEVFAVGAAGWVTISSDGVRLVLVEVVAAAGWSAEVTDLKDDQIDVTFSHPETDATFTAQLNDGVVKIDIDPGKAVSEQDPGPSEVEVFAVGAAGWVTISSDGVRLVLVEVVAAAGWSAEVTDLKDDQIDVTFSHPETDATFTAQLNDGVVKIDIDPGESVSS